MQVGVRAGGRSRYHVAYGIKVAAEQVIQPFDDLTTIIRGSAEHHEVVKQEVIEKMVVRIGIQAPVGYAYRPTGTDSQGNLSWLQ